VRQRALVDGNKGLVAIKVAIPAIGTAKPGRGFLSTGLLADTIVSETSEAGLVASDPPSA
jgi:hypothetical protein